MVSFDAITITITHLGVPEGLIMGLTNNMALTVPLQKNKTRISLPARRQEDPDRKLISRIKLTEESEEVKVLSEVEGSVLENNLIFLA